MKTKTFDCVEMKRRGARAVYEAVRGMTVDEELEYWRARTDELRNRLKAQQAKQEPDEDEVRRRAVAATGRLHSGTGDVAAKHDDYAAEAHTQ